MFSRIKLKMETHYTYSFLKHHVNSNSLGYKLHSQNGGKFCMSRSLYLYLLRPQRRVFHALVRAGSTCQEAPDLSGPIMSHL